MKNVLKCLVLLLMAVGFADVTMAQTKKKKPATRKVVKRATPPKTSAVIDTAVASPAMAVNKDTLPIKQIRKSLRQDEAVETASLRDRIPLPYEHLRADDAVYRQKIWREIDAREKINLPFRYAADDDRGNQRFISILLQAIQDSAVTVFNAGDDRFTTPMTTSEVAKVISGEEVEVPDYDSLGNLVGSRKMRNDINLDSFYKFRIKEEVIFDKESSRLFWRILGIAPVKSIITSSGVNIGESELFWVYYPDMRATFAKYEVYNGKNFGARMSWEELFESRMFSGRIIKSSMDNPYDLLIKNYKGLDDKPILQLMEGDNVREKVFNYEQDLWQY